MAEESKEGKEHLTVQANRSCASVVEIVSVPCLPVACVTSLSPLFGYVSPTDSPSLALSLL